MFQTLAKYNAIVTDCGGLLDSMFAIWPRFEPTQCDLNILVGVTAMGLRFEYFDCDLKGLCATLSMISCDLGSAI